MYYLIMKNIDNLFNIIFIFYYSFLLKVNMIRMLNIVCFDYKNKIFNYFFIFIGMLKFSSFLFYI